MNNEEYRDHRLMVRVGRMHYEQGLRQSQVAAKLEISQTKVSRLLKRAEREGIIRTVVIAPDGLHTDLEEAIEKKYGLEEVVVVDAEGTTRDVLPALASAGAEYVHRSFTVPTILGVSAWSETLAALSMNLRSEMGAKAQAVVQLVGGAGRADAHMASVQMLARFSNALDASPILIPTPGVASNEESQRVMTSDPVVASAIGYWDQVETALLGIGGLEASPTLQRSGNVGDDQGRSFQELGAIGDICLRHFDQDGTFIQSEYDRRVIGVSPKQLSDIPRRIGIAGGSEKHRAITGAALGGILTTLITDVETATELAKTSRQET
ncbi:sugar-binding transcriptional regulator [Paramicrobacterium chengjingii]|uniref:Winged helix-turn-helix transcriptional regulator n=1 Tax=Paramicrobacterium chengjingii TaxID=2769067 RepID=A0ABX6YHN6_9MICO|nr:sugar-binding domain-containing protein [Microbacterium chengjingii]QPZ38309.1 winged helix-turn-helix transcriptional regulator [Microbacterium chengjingii]